MNRASVRELDYSGVRSTPFFSFWLRATLHIHLFRMCRCNKKKKTPVRPSCCVNPAGAPNSHREVQKVVQNKWTEKKHNTLFIPRGFMYSLRDDAATLLLGRVSHQTNTLKLGIQRRFGGDNGLGAVLLQQLERHNFHRLLVCALQHDQRGFPSPLRLQPSRGTQTPAFSFDFRPGGSTKACTSSTSRRERAAQRLG